MNIKHTEVVMEKYDTIPALHGGTEENYENFGPKSLSLDQDVPPQYDRVPSTKPRQDNHFDALLQGKS